MHNFKAKVKTLMNLSKNIISLKLWYFNYKPKMKYCKHKSIKR